MVSLDSTTSHSRYLQPSKSGGLLSATVPSRPRSFFDPGSFGIDSSNHSSGLIPLFSTSFLTFFNRSLAYLDYQSATTNMHRQSETSGGGSSARGGRGARGRGSGRGSVTSTCLSTQTKTKYRCALGGEMRELNAFSDNQKRRVRFSPSTTNPLACGMICREHVNGNATTYQCQGACNKVCIPCQRWLDSEPVPGTVRDDSDGYGSEAEYHIVYPDSEQTPESQGDLPSSSSGVATHGGIRGSVKHQAGANDDKENPSLPAPVTSTNELVPSNIQLWNWGLPVGLKKDDTSSGQLTPFTTSGTEFDCDDLIDLSRKPSKSIRGTKKLVSISSVGHRSSYDFDQLSIRSLQRPISDQSSIVPNTWYEPDGQGSDTQRTVQGAGSPGLYKEPSEADLAVSMSSSELPEIRADSKAGRGFSDTETQKSLRKRPESPPRFDRRAIMSWDDGGKPHVRRREAQSSKAEETASILSEQDKAGVVPVSGRDILPPRTIKCRTRREFMDRMPNTTFSSPYLSDDDN